MTKRTCATDDCQSPIYGHGMCSKHYQRAKRAGNLPSSKTCTIDGCADPQKARGWCNTHWTRWSRYGDPLVDLVPHFNNSDDSFNHRTRRASNGCLEWTGADNGGEYGKIRANGSNVYVHRYVWERNHGPIPAGMFVDHICLNPRCCEIKHLRLATNKQNLEHRAGAQKNNKSSGVRGVSAHGQRWVAQVGHNGQLFYCGIFDTIIEAEQAAIDKRIELFSHNLIDRIAG